MNHRCFSFGLSVLLAAAICVVPVGATFAADDPVPANEGQSDGDEKQTAEGEEEKKGFWARYKDPEDGRLDIMASGGGEAGFLPLAVPFNEPAVGAGLAAALAYFHPQKGAAPEAHGASSGPPTATFGGGAGTTNGSWFAAGGHNHVWKEDAIRYLGAAFVGSVNLTFFGYGDGGSSESDGRDFNLESVGLVQQGKFRIGRSPVLLGAKYVFMATETTFETQTDLPGTGDSDLAGLTGLVEYDTRDTVFTPNRGLRGTLDISWFAEALGGDFDYGTVSAGLRYYWPVAPNWVLGFRADYDFVGDDAPFYALSYVKLRGVPVFRYLGHYVLTFELEPRYKIDERWSVVAFTGTGRAAREAGTLSEADKVYNYGAGFRYLLARKLGLGAGIDIARGPEETVGYIIIGSAW